MISRHVAALAAAALALLAAAPPATAQSATPAGAAPEPRIALVIGNSAYAVSPLRNPANDAADMANRLRELGFRVELRTDADGRAMRQALREFGQALRQGGVGLFYFAGHGVQSRGRNFLVPVAANIESEAELEDQAIDANLVLGYMEEADNRVNIVVLDACRNNPFARTFRSASRGLAQMDAARGSFIAFATAPGSVASDGTGRNGLYTERLLESLKHPDSDIDKVFRRVTADVSGLTQGRQVPWVASSLTGDFSFHPPAAAHAEAAAGTAATGAKPERETLDLAFWESIKDSRNAGEFRAYLEEFPDGRFAALARMRLAALESRQGAAAGAGESAGGDAAAQSSANRMPPVSFAALEEARGAARENALYNARRWRSALYPHHEILSRGDSTQAPDCPQGDGWATIDLYDRSRKLAVQLKCSTVSPHIGCLEISDFRSRPYAHEDGTCQPTVKVPFPLPKFAR